MKATSVIAYRRKREGKTNYKKRLKLLLSKKPRLVIKKSLNNLTAQIIEFNPKGDKVLIGVSTKTLEKLGWKAHRGNITSAYLLGFLIGKKSKVKEAIVDLGLQLSKNKTALYAVVKGAIDAGMKIPCSEEIFPSEERISGKHISDYAKALKTDKEKYNKQFSKMIKNNIDPEKMEKYFEEMKNKIGGGASK